mmetsp:Transcript_20911/g.55887  ORF Transcript_20911/g.55887 Transcript_20911/m.55887 type:complete len:104 (+) Transcript_20911:285-596(+)
MSPMEPANTPLTTSAELRRSEELFYKVGSKKKPQRRKSSSYLNPLPRESSREEDFNLETLLSWLLRELCGQPVQQLSDLSPRHFILNFSLRKAEISCTAPRHL